MTITEIITDLGQLLVDNAEDLPLTGHLYPVTLDATGPRMVAETEDGGPATITEVIAELGRCLLRYGDVEMRGLLCVKGYPFPAINSAPVCKPEPIGEAAHP